MQHLVPISEIKERAEAIGVTLKVLARDAKLSPSTAYRGAAPGGNPRQRTIEKLLAALLVREQYVRAHIERVAVDKPADDKRVPA